MQDDAYRWPVISPYPFLFLKLDPVVSSMDRSNSCKVTSEVIAEVDRYHLVVYLVWLHCPHVMRDLINQNPKLAASVQSSLRTLVAPCSETTPMSHSSRCSGDNMHAVSADQFIGDVRSPYSSDSERNEIQFEDFFLTETTHAVYLSTSQLDAETSGQSTIFFTMRRLSGGITNELFHAFASDMTNSVVVRVFGKETDRVISRESEFFYQSLFLRTYVHGDNFIIYEYLEGYDALLFQEMPTNADRIADAIAQFHVTATMAAKKDHDAPLLTSGGVGTTSIGMTGNPALHQVKKELSRYQRETNYTYHSLTLWPEMMVSTDIVNRIVVEKRGLFCELAQNLKSETVWMVQQIRDVEDKLGEGVCHNDLLCGNIMSQDDLPIKIIDFDYAHRNFLLFDLANHFNEYTGLECDYAQYFPSDEHITKFVRVYRSRMRYYLQQTEGEVFDCQHALFFTESAAEEESATQGMAEACKLMSLTSHLFWALWSLLQEAVSAIEMDFLEYSGMRYQRYLETKEEFQMSSTR